MIDLIIEILRGSKSREQVKKLSGKRGDGRDQVQDQDQYGVRLQNFILQNVRATAILDMRLYKLIGLEIETLVAEHEETLKKIASYEDILNNYDSRLL